VRILHLIDVFDARYERDQIEIAKFLEKKGHDVTVITSKYCDDGLKRDKSQFEVWERKFSKAKILHMPSLKMHIPFFKPVIVYLPTTSTMFSWDYDIVHAYSLGSYSSFLSIFFKNFKKLKVILRTDLGSPTYKRAKKNFLYKEILTKPLKIADAVYAFTNKEMEYLVDLGIPKEKIWVIPVGVDYERFLNIRSNLGAANVFTIGYIGRYLRGKGVHRIVSPLLRLLKTFSSIKVLFAGPRTDANYADNIIRKMETNGNFEYNGIMNAVQFFDMCDIVIVPSLIETGAKVVLEAMAAGKAIVASNINPISDYIKHGYSGLLVDSDDQIYTFSKNLIENPSLIENIGHNARNEAAKYDWKTIINNLETMYESVMCAHNTI
jgi:glycosyltransferase involved in cell wall biosynthesis